MFSKNWVELWCNARGKRTLQAHHSGNPEHSGYPISLYARTIFIVRGPGDGRRGAEQVKRLCGKEGEIERYNLSEMRLKFYSTKC